MCMLGFFRSVTSFFKVPYLNILNRGPLRNIYS